MLKIQCVLKWFPSSAILKGTKDGWQISPTRRSEAAKQNRKKNDGDCSSCLVRITCRITALPIHVIIEHTELRKHTMALGVKGALVGPTVCPKRHRFYRTCSSLVFNQLYSETCFGYASRNVKKRMSRMYFIWGFNNAILVCAP